MSQQGSLSIERMCQLAPVSRAGFYRALQESQPLEAEMAVRAEIQHIALAHRRRYGYRRITAELRRGLQPRAFVATTDAQHELEVYLNLASRLTLTGTNQLWVADITYIRLRAEFVYLAVILDGFSRKVVGWALDTTLATRLPLSALHQAIGDRHPPPGAVHHSDRGIQYASGAYVQLLRQHQMIPSMSRPANPYDNASCESFLKTLKREEIYANTYRDLDHLRTNMAAFIDQYYNRIRLHSALGYRPAEEFERTAAGLPGAARMQFFQPAEDFNLERRSDEPERATTETPVC
jgi:transposase InsO family protein